MGLQLGHMGRMPCTQVIVDSKVSSDRVGGPLKKKRGKSGQEIPWGIHRQEGTRAHFTSDT